MKKIILLILVVLLTGCGIKKIEMNHYEIDKIPYMFPLKYKQSNESNEYYHCYQLDKNNKITLKAIDVESMSKRKEAYAFLKNEIYQTYHTEENVKKRSYQSDNTDKPGYRYEFKNKNILIVAHAGISVAVECYFNGIPKDDKLVEIRLKNCEYRKYEMKD